VLASVPVPPPAPQAKSGEAPAEKPTSIAGLLGNIFSGEEAQPSPPVAANQPAAKPLVLRGSSNDTAKPKTAAPVRAASKPPAVATAKPGANPKPVTVLAPAPPAKPRAAPVDTANGSDSQPDSREMRTAFSAQRASNGGLLLGAQPVVPVGSFDARWSALR
jgi:hypothetical protein